VIQSLVAELTPPPGPSGEERSASPAF